MAVANYGIGISSPVADGGVAHYLDTVSAFATGRLLSLRNATTEKVAVAADGTITATGFAGLGSSLTALSATNIASGNLAYARLPTGTGAWDTGVGTTVTITRSLTVSGTLTGTLTGNAATATELATARDINGVSFNGTASITVMAAAGTLTGTVLAATVVTSSLTTVGSLIGGAVPASLVTAGSFPVGAFVFQGALTANSLVLTTALAAAEGGTSFDTWTAGDLLYASALNTLAKLAIGTSGQVLTVTAGLLPAWATLSIAWADVSKVGSSLADLATRSAGDLSSGNLAYARLPAGDGTWAFGTASTNNLILSNAFGTATVYVAGSTPGASNFGVGAQPLTDSHVEAAGGSGSATILPSVIRARSTVNAGDWATGAANPWGLFDFYSGDATLGPGSRAGLSAHMEAGSGGPVGMALWVGPGAGRTLTLTLGSDLSALFAGAVTATSFTGGLVGNASTATALQTARLINGVSFNGTADITISVTAAAGTLTGTTLAANVVTSSLTTLGTVASLVASGTTYLTSSAVVGHTAQIDLQGAGQRLGIHGITALAVIGITRWSANALGSSMYLAKSRGAAVGTFATVSSASTGDVLGTIGFLGDDGTDLDVIGARIRAVVVPGSTVSGNRIPTALAFATALGSGANDIADKMYLHHNGHLATVALAKHFYDGLDAQGDSFIWESAANVLALVAGGTTALSLSTAGIAISNALNAVSPTAPNRTVTMVVAGTTVYISAKTTND